MPKISGTLNKGCGVSELIVLPLDRISCVGI